MNKAVIPSARLSGFYFFYFAVIGAFMPYWSLYLEQQGFSKTDIGLLASVTVVTRIVAPSVWGWLADRSGLRMRWVRLGTVAQLVAWTAVVILPNTLAYLVLILLVFSFFQNAILAQFEAVTLFWLGQQRERYGVVRLWGSIGFIVAVFALGWWFDLTSVAQLPIIMIGLAGLAVINAYLIQEPPRQQHGLLEQVASIRSVLLRPRVMLFFALELLLLLSHAPFYSFYSNYMQAAGYSTNIIGLLWAVGVLAEVLMFTQTQRLLARYTERGLILCCLGLTVLRWTLVAMFAHVLWVQLLAQSCHAFSFALFQALAMRLIFEEFSASQQGRGQATFSMIWGIGVALGSVLGGAVWDQVGGDMVFALAAGVCGLAVWLCWAYWPRPLNTPSVDECA
jgi:PPP family 3-phenylpropionic acid transporter